MSNDIILNKIKCILPNIQYRYHNDKLELNLTDTNNPYHGIARHLSETDKKAVLSLINRLENLNKLNLRKNRFGKNIFILNNITSLEELNLGSNYIGEFPHWINNNKNLKYLNLGVNELKNIEIDLPLLETLKIHKNPIIALPELNLIKDINFYLCPIKTIPTSPYLTSISCGGSPIKEIPEELSKELIWLSVVSSEIKKIPNEIHLLSQLRGLRLSKNQIESLPESIGELQNLEELSLYQNNIKTLPASFSRLKLKKLNLKRNSIDNLSIINKTSLTWAAL